MLCVITFHENSKDYRYQNRPLGNTTGTCNPRNLDVFAGNVYNLFEKSGRVTHNHGNYKVNKVNKVN